MRIDELVTPLAMVLSSAEDATFRWLNDFPPPTPPPSSPKISGAGVRERGGPSDPLLKELRSFLDEHPEERVVVDWAIDE
jgi:hypothetical protein